MQYLEKRSYNFPQYLMWGVLGIVFLIFVFLLAYFLIMQHIAAEQEFNDLRNQILEEQRQRIVAEADDAAEHVLFAYSQAEQVLQAQSRSQVEQAISVAWSLYNQNKGGMPEPELRNLIIETLREIRFFGGRGYLFVDDMEGNCVLLPTAPHLEGKSLIDNQDDTGHYIMRGLIDAVSNPEGRGFSKYRWYPPGSNAFMMDKLAYVQKFEPYDWIIGTGDYLYRIEQDLQKPELERLAQLRFGKNGYIAVVSSDGTLLKSAGAPYLEGEHFSMMNERDGKTISMILDKAREGGGFLEYDWYLPNGDPVMSKVGYVKPLPVWGWIIITGFYPDDLNNLIMQRQEKLDNHFQQHIYKLLIAFGVFGTIAIVISMLFSRWIRKLFNAYRTEIESRQQTLEDNAKSMEISARIVTSASEGILVTDADNRIIEVNEAFTRITGYSAEEILGQHPRKLASGKHDASFYKQLWRTLLKEGTWQGEIWNRRKNGELYPEWLSLTLYRDETGKILNHIATFSDISHRKQYEERLSYLADYDTLTDLPNRRMLSDRLSQQLAEVHRNKAEKLAVIFVDLDHFKNINDSLGHAAGDAVLIEIAKRLKACVREGDTVSRIGGDEFVLLVKHSGDILTPAAHLSERILETVAQPILYNKEVLVLTCSLGVAVAPDDGDSVEALLKNADTALYHAKHEGRDNFQFFTQEMNQRVTLRMEMEARIRAGLSNNEFTLHYQPQLSLETGRIESVEALIRWRQADGSLIPPNQFIPVAEESGQIIELGSWIIQRACDDAASWLAKGMPVSVAINISTRQLRYSKLAAVIHDALQSSGLPAQYLIIEITETALMGNMENTIQVLSEIRNMGIRISLDDFGTGYSSLTFLKSFPVDELKIDRSFIDGLPDDSDDAAITSSLIYVAHSLDLNVVAEGVETEQQQTYLQQRGCDKAQGFLFSKAVPAHDIEPLLSRNPSVPVE